MAYRKEINNDELYLYMDGRLIYKKWLRTGQSKIFDVAAYDKYTLVSINEDGKLKKRMDIADLYAELKNIGIPDSQIYLHGLYGSTDDNEKLALTIKMGDNRPIWEVYFKERGQINSSHQFDDENSACEYYLKKCKV
jgi:hypothetical protein